MGLNAETLRQLTADNFAILTTLQRARRQGCPALQDGKVALASFLRWWCSDDRPVSPEYERVRGEWVALKNARLALLVRQMKGELLSAEAVQRLGAELGHAIRKQALHRS